MTDYPRQWLRPEGAPAFSLALPPGLMGVTGRDAQDFIAARNDEPLIAGVVAANGPAEIAITLARAEDFLSAGLEPISVGGERFRHAALSHVASEEGDEIRVRTIVVTDGARAFRLTARCPASIWEDYGPFLEAAMMSFELETPEEMRFAPPRAPSGEEMAERRAFLEMERLIAAGKLDEADRAAGRLADSLQRGAALGRLYTEALRRANTRNEAERLYERARRWRLSAFPDPHTQIEANEFRAAQEEAQAELLALLEAARERSG